MAQFPNLLAALADVPDPRRAQGKRYPLPYVLMFTVLALLSGARSTGVVCAGVADPKTSLPRQRKV